MCKIAQNYNLPFILLMSYAYDVLYISNRLLLLVLFLIPCFVSHIFDLVFFCKCDL